MSVSICSRIEHVAGPRGFRAAIFVSFSGKSASIEVWRGRRRMDTRRTSTTRAPQRAGDLLNFWSAPRGTP
jgi:hypothetical protein